MSCCVPALHQPLEEHLSRPEAVTAHQQRPNDAAIELHLIPNQVSPQCRGRLGSRRQVKQDACIVLAMQTYLGDHFSRPQHPTAHQQQ